MDLDEEMIRKRLLSRWKFSSAPTELSDRMLTNARIPAEYAEARIGRIPKTCAHREALVGYAQLAEENARDANGLILYGTHGSGKTAAACALLTHYIRHRVAGLFIRWTDIARIFKDWRDTDLYDRIMLSRILVIDDVGEQIPQDFDYTVASFISIIRHRYDERLPTIITTNLMLNDCIERFANISTILASERFLSIRMADFNWRNHNAGGVKA